MGYTSELINLIDPKLIPVKIIWINIYVCYIILSLAVIFFIPAFSLILHYKEHDKKLKTFLEITLILTIILIILAANNSATVSDDYTVHRVIGRYISPILPLWIILSIIGFEKYNIESFKKKYVIYIFAYTIIMTLVMLQTNTTYYPINNTELIPFGIIQTLLH